MRDIIFRGKRIDTGEWVCSGSLIHFNEGNEYYIPAVNSKCICTHDENDNIIEWNGVLFYKVIPETVGQYIGTQDKNGNLLFEGDIVKDNKLEYRLLSDRRKTERSGLSVVEYGLHDVPSDDPYCWGGALGFHFKGETMYPTPAQYISLYRNYKDLSFEVIGNIYDNPELLEEVRSDA